MFYEPEDYVKWGAICFVIGIVPNVYILGIGLFVFGVALAVINGKGRKIVAKAEPLHPSDIAGYGRSTIIDGECQVVRGDS